MKFPADMAEYLTMREEVVALRTAGRGDEVNEEWSKIKERVMLLLAKSLANREKTAEDQRLDEAFDMYWNGPRPTLDPDRIEQTFSQEDLYEILEAAFHAAVDINYRFPTSE